MATPFQNIYDKFLNLIEDYELAIIPDDELDYLLFSYLDRAVSLDFKQCRKDLTNYNKELKQFNEDLTGEEQWIIAYGMVLSWLESKIKRERLLRDAISDRDYEESSHANQLKELLNLEESTRKKLTEYILNYTFNDFDGLS